MLQERLWQVLVSPKGRRSLEMSEDRWRGADDRCRGELLEERGMGCRMAEIFGEPKEP